MARFVGFIETCETPIASIAALTTWISAKHNCPSLFQKAGGRQGSRYSVRSAWSCPATMVSRYLMVFICAPVYANRQGTTANNSGRLWQRTCLQKCILQSNVQTDGNGACTPKIIKESSMILLFSHMFTVPCQATKALPCPVQRWSPS